MDSFFRGWPGLAPAASYRAMRGLPGVEHQRERSVVAMIRKRRGCAVGVHQLDGVGVDAPIGHFHAGGAGRHSRQGQAERVGLFGQQPLDVIGGHMPFDEIAANLGGVAARIEEAMAIILVTSWVVTTSGYGRCANRRRCC